jgi:hypothetical protein
MELGGKLLQKFLTSLKVVSLALAFYIVLYLIFLLDSGRQYGYWGIFFDYFGWFWFFLIIVSMYQSTLNSNTEKYSQQNSAEVHFESFFTLNTFFMVLLSFWNFVWLVVFFGSLIGGLTLLITLPLQVLTIFINKIFFLRKKMYIPVIAFIICLIITIICYVYIGHFSILFSGNNGGLSLLYLAIDLTTNYIFIFQSFVLVVLDLIYYKKLNSLSK